ncbi:acyl-CoA carboxylase subunit epsilon [Streptomyces sp. NBC_01298]|uniref:acyl-CoA carboxylase subunit epsilon n=1 Tax=unclassified Streptomyces TaxID=2593676 RepID=UPI002E0ECD62|nr:acyl-CoA carboxylase subunit epsilon [Streptomyces sp. NBC_01298]
MSNANGTLLKVEKGNAEPEELAAITAILLARAAATPEYAPAAAVGSQAGWRRLERTPGFRGPRSWQG